MSPTRSHLRNIVLGAVASTCLVPLATHAQFPDQLPIPADVKAFATQYIAAINAKDSAKL
jgi:hypothetical protein